MLSRGVLGKPPCKTLLGFPKDHGSPMLPRTLPVSSLLEVFGVRGYIAQEKPCALI